MEYKRWLPVLLGLALVAGCARSDPLATKVAARSPIAFAMWHSQTGTALSAEQWRDFDAAVQEIKFQVAAEYAATGTEAVDEAMRQRVDEQTVRRVLELGDLARLTRLKSDRAELAHFLEVNATMRTRPDDQASIAYLKGLRDRQVARLEALDAEIAERRAQMRSRSSGAAPGR